MIISPLRASMTLPSTVIETVSTGVSVTSVIGAGSVLDVDEELVAEHLDGRDDGHRRRRTQEADRGHRVREPEPGGDVVADVEQEVEVAHAAVARLDAVHDLRQPAGALAARRALPARLPLEEAHE